MQDTHSLLSRSSLATAESKFENSVSSHLIKTNIAFSTLTSVLLQAGDYGKQTFLGTTPDGFTISVAFKYVAPPAQTATGKKRVRDTIQEEVERDLDKVCKKMGSENGITPPMLEQAKTAILKLSSMRGSKQERVVESWGLHSKAPSTDASAPKLILSAKLTPGVALSLCALKEALGSCFADGMLTTQREELASGFQLPLTEHARVAEEEGVASLTIFATVGGE